VDISEFEAQLQAAADILIEKSREATLEWAATVEALCKQADTAEVPEHLAMASIQLVVARVEKAANDLEKEL
jgi:hypothetical protein